MSAYRPLAKRFYLRDAETVARDLIGRFLVRRLDGERLVLRIVEAEAYLGAPDPASHAAGGRRTVRTETLYREGGCAYVYLVYGMHHCLNAVVGPAGDGSAVLIRAGQAAAGEQAMRRHRGLAGPPRPGQLASGPGRLTQALAIDLRFDAAPLTRGDLVLTRGEPAPPEEIARGPRVGVDYAGEAAAWPLRFALRGHPEVSRPRLWASVARGR